MTYIYPTKIQTTTGHSIAHHTQKITNPSNLCSDSKSLAYWGVKHPTNVGVYMRNYYDSITTKSGSYNKPEIIYATSWDTGKIPTNAIVNKITIQYKWEQISSSCGTWDCYGRFEKPTITLIHNDKKLYTFKGAKPEAIRYNNNTTNESKMNTNSANLATLHSHTIDISKHKLTVGQLQKAKIKFDPAENTYTNYCRIVMQFIRIKIDYTASEKTVEFLPNYRITNVSVTPANPEIPCWYEDGVGMDYWYTCTIKSTVPYVKTTTCTVLPLTEDTIIDASSVTHSPSGNSYNKDTGIWTISKFNNYQATIRFKVHSNYPGEKKIKATINKYADSVQKSDERKINVTKVPDTVSWQIGLEGEKEPYIFNGKENKLILFKIKINRTCDRPNRHEKIKIDTQGWITENVWHRTTQTGTPTHLGDGVWEISEIQGKDVTITAQNSGHGISIQPGEYHITVTHSEDGKLDETKNLDIYVTNASLPMDYFKLRLEDGSDVKYNSLMVTAGDDLQFPITYEPLKDDFIDNIQIDGESKKIPTHEARYVTYTLKSDKDIENALCKIDIVGNNFHETDSISEEILEDASNIIIGCDDQIQLLDNDGEKFCIINKLVANEEKKIKFIVQSEIEQVCIFKLNFLNYAEPYESEKWTPSIITFEDMPSVKLSVEADPNDIDTDINDTVEVKYTIENKSNVDGSRIKFRLKEPTSFKILSYDVNSNYSLTSQPDQYSNLFSLEQPIFNENNRTLTFPNLPGQQYDEIKEEFISQKHTLSIKYQATEKGIFDFSIFTVDDRDITEDDQWENSATAKVMVNVSSNVLIKTSTDKIRPFLNEFIDFKINFKNYSKPQSQLQFSINDIGNYDPTHSKNDYELQYYTATKGSLEYDNIGLNNIGKWTINDVNINDKEEIVLTLQPKAIGYHTIETNFMDSNGQIQTFKNVINVLEPNKQLEFNVYHGVGISDDTDCNDIDNIIEICDDDYIDIGDYLFFICEITNNNRNNITDTTHIYARLDDTFLDNGIICSTHQIEQYDNNLLHITIPTIKGCQTTKICFKVQPSTIGTYTNNFMLSNHNAHVYHQKLKINVNEEFDQKQLEHEINIYNFEKTNHYFRYELDSDNNIFKFFNQGPDKSLRMIDTEEYGQGSVETYKGTNLKKIIRDIANNSKYVEPQLLRTGSNKFMPKGYEIYPDGFIRRFGLLNSEVFHYTGQLPTISHLSDKAMKWDQDTWDTKVWGGDIYDNGVFDITIDYGKIPANFNVLDIKNPIDNLQALVDKTKPFGTKALCYYSTKLYLDLKMNMDLQRFEVGQELDIPLNISDIGLISLYNKHDNSLAAYYDLFNLDLTTDTDVSICTQLSKERDKQTGELRRKPYNSLSLKTDTMIAAEVYDQQYSKKYISDCFDIVNNLYAHNPSIKNIDIIKDYNYEPQNLRDSFSPKLKNIYCFEYNDYNNTVIQIEDDIYTIKCEKDTFNQFIGVKIYKNEEEIFATNFLTDINNYNIQIQICKHPYMDNKYIVHMFCSINSQSYIHIGYIIFNNTDIIQIQSDQHESYSKTNTDQPIKFQIRNTVQTHTEQPSKIIDFGKDVTWNNINNVKTNKNYASIENNIDIDIECKQTSVKAPILGFKYTNLPISDNDEIIDINFKMNAKTNKTNFIKDLKITPCLHGDSYVPENGMAQQLYYPNRVTNVTEDYTNSIVLQQPNITICSNCLHTALGLYDECPYCGSEQVSQYDNKKAVTICRNPDCQWITDGWYDYCPHCLSQDVEKTKVDFNRTVCYEHGVFDDYYPVCPKCFSEKVEHINNDQRQYQIGDSDTQNIDPIVIKSDTNRVNICNIEVKTDIIKEAASTLEYLNLHLYGTNNNDGKFYYCEECNKAGLGNVEKCLHCQNTTIQQYPNQDLNSNNVIIDIYYQVGNLVKKVNQSSYKVNDNFDIEIDILSLAQETIQPSFKLLVYVENLSYDNINTFIEKIKNNIDSDSYDLLAENIPLLNMSLDNIYYDYKYLNEELWSGLDNLQHTDHTGIIYTAEKNDNTNYIKFSKFNIKNNSYDKLYLNIAGINKADKHIDLDIVVTDQDKNTFSHTVNGINPNLFTEQINLFDFVDSKRLENMTVQIKFKNVQQQSKIIITHLYLTGVINQTKKLLYHKTIDQKYNIIQQENDTYLISSQNLFGLKDTAPYYIDGKVLDTNLICYLDFGQLHNQEYIRLYSMDMIITYKNRYGKIITECIDITTHTNINEPSCTMSKGEYTKYMSNAKLQKNNAEIWGAIQSPISILNNLESQIFNNSDEESLQSTPLKYELLQAFTISATNIGQIYLNYDGCVGYPNDLITVQIYDDYQNTPDNLLYSNDILMPRIQNEIIIDVNLDDLPLGQYWIKLIDHNANKNNYHRFKHNDNLGVGNFIITNSPQHSIQDFDKVLSFGIDSNSNTRQYYNAPITLDLNGITNFKTCYTFYRYNTKSINNAYVYDIENQAGFLCYDDRKEEEVDLTDDKEDDNNELGYEDESSADNTDS